MEYNFQQPYPPVFYPNYGTVSSNQNQNKYNAGANSWYWVPNAAEAVKNWTVYPGSMVMLIDTETSEAYFKSIDSTTGKPVVTPAKIVFENNTPKTVSYATKEDLDILSKTIADLREELEGLSIKRPKKKGEDE
jgi:hypothetical protein